MHGLKVSPHRVLLEYKRKSLTTVETSGKTLSGGKINFTTRERQTYVSADGRPTVIF